MNTLLNILGLSLVAGLGTGLGGLLAILVKPGKRIFGFLMGMTAGVMICLSFLQLINEAWHHGGYLTTTIGFGIGAGFMFLVDFLTPHIRFGEQETSGLGKPCQDEKGLENRTMHRHRRRRQWRRARNRIHDPGLFKTGILVAIGIAIHNAPEGISIGAGYMHTPQFGIFIALAIALHNIPEGIATALPLCNSGMGRWNAFRVALLSGLTEPLGALLAALFLTPFKFFVPGALAFAGGVMTFISLDELVPCAREHGHQHFTALGIILGTILVFLLSGLMGV